MFSISLRFSCLSSFQAGIGHVGDSESAAYCVQPDLDPRRTAQPFDRPDELNQDQLKWRQSYRREPGQRFIHAGLVGAPVPGPDYRHGIRTTSGDKAGDVFTGAGGPESDLAAFKLMQKESIYRSNIREPLGSGYIRGHQLPTKVHDPQFRFGVSTSESESAKNVIYHPTAAPLIRSHGAVDTSPLNQTTDEYGRTLGSTTTTRAAAQYHTMASTAAGASDAHQQERLITRPIDREYNWTKAGIDPTKHRFGKVVNANPAGSYATGVSSVLKHNSTEEDRTTIGSKRVEEAKSNTYDHLGKGRRQRGALAGDINDPTSSAHGDRLNYSGHRSMTFGRPGQHDEWGARDCIRGTYSEQEQLPDPDLGKSKFQLTNLEHLPARHADRAFGLPSIRADRPPPKMKSIANDMNYGDESNGRGLLYPSQFAFEGINEEDFLRQRTPDQIKSVFKTLGMEFSPSQFDRIVALAISRYGALSVDSFRHAWNQVRLEIICQDCGALLCQHEDCALMKCRHTENANHSIHSKHLKQDQPKQIQPAGFTHNR